MNMLNAPFKKFDEFDFFHKAFSTLYAKDPQYMSNLLQSLTPEEKRYLQEHMHSKRVEIENKDFLLVNVVEACGEFEHLSEELR